MLLSKHMIGHDEDHEEVSFKVTDRRKFNADGSVKDGVVIEPAATKAPAPAEAETAPEAAAEHARTAAKTPEAIMPEENDEDSYADDADDIPGAEDPASFVNFLSTLATNAAAALGAMPHPATGKRSVDLETGKYWLDVLAMLTEKTKGNLHPKESRLLEGILADLRMQYVTMVRATEEKLKAQAAKQFSDADILGKK
jgi:Domain of unknown function (DUF1844)